MLNGSNCDRKSQLSKILTEPLNPRAMSNSQQYYWTSLTSETNMIFYLKTDNFLKFKLYICFYHYKMHTKMHSFEKISFERQILAILSGINCNQLLKN